MAATIKFKRGTTDPSALTAGEPAFNTSGKKFFVGDGSSQIWVGAEIKPTATIVWSSDTTIPTAKAVSDYVGNYKPTDVTVAAGSGTLYPIFSTRSDAGATSVNVDAGISYDASGNTLTVGGDLAVNGGELSTTQTTFDFVTSATTTNIGSIASNSKTVINGIELKIGTSSAAKSIGCNYAGSGAELLNFYSNYDNLTANQRTVNFGGGVAMTVATGNTVATTINLGTDMTNNGSAGMDGIVTTVNLGTAGSNSTLSIINFNTNAAVRSAQELRFNDSDDSHYVAFKSPTTVANSNVYTLPDAVGTQGQVLKLKTVAGNNATLEWAADGAGSVDVATSSSTTGFPREKRLPSEICFPVSS